MYISLHLCKLKQEMGFLRFFFPPPGFQSSSADLHSSTGEELFFPTFANICEPQLLAILIDQEWLGVVFVWNAVGTWSLLFPCLLISAGVLSKGDRRRRRSPKISGMLWPMRKPGSWQRSGRWRWRTARLPKSWRSASMRSSRWASAWVSVWGHLLQPPGWSLVGPVLGQCVLYENRNQTCLSRKELDIPSWLIHFSLYRWGNWGSDREEIVCSGDWFEDRARIRTQPSASQTKGPEMSPEESWICGQTNLGSSSNSIAHCCVTLGSLLNFSELLVCNIRNNNTLLEIFGGFKEMKNVNFSAQDRTLFVSLHICSFWDSEFGVGKGALQSCSKKLKFPKKKT